MEKRCNGCNKYMSVSMFHKRSDSPNAYHPKCKKCHLIVTNENRRIRARRKKKETDLTKKLASVWR